MGQRRRGVVQGQNIEQFFIGTSMNAKSPAAFKKTTRLNTIGTSHSQRINGLQRAHHRLLPQLPAANDLHILDFKAGVHVSSVTPDYCLPEGFSKRHMKTCDRVNMSLPLNLRSNQLET